MPRSFLAVASGRVLPSSVTLLFSSIAVVISGRECLAWSAIAAAEAKLRPKTSVRAIADNRKNEALGIRPLLGIGLLSRCSVVVLVQLLLESSIKGSEIHGPITEREDSRGTRHPRRTLGSNRFGIN